MKQILSLSDPTQSTDIAVVYLFHGKYIAYGTKTITKLNIA
jgi:hypothetical protein